MAASIILIIIELATLWISTLCFAVGCIVAMCFSLMGFHLPAQCVALAVAALITFVVAGPRVIKYHQRKRFEDSNVSAMKGKTAVVVERIPRDGEGRVKLDGDNWQARSVDNLEIEKGQVVTIVDNESIVMIVRRHE
jgi:membrane protein implicated in regulation of membrane protease activity